MTDKIIVTRKLVKTYEESEVKVNALRGVDLTVDGGEFMAIAGPSGSGKTTLLNIIGGLDVPTGGSVVVGGKDLSGLSKSELSDMRLRNLGFIFQSYNLIPVLSALENVEYVMLLQGVPKEERQRRAVDILEDVGLADYIDARPNEMSGGQQQRVAVARAIVSNPEVVLADEPTANLDSETGESLLTMMGEMNERRGVTFIFSTHDKMVMDHSRRLVKLKDGKIVEDIKK
ncbi:MAG: ABC transporter ATP-binding protein [Deltaproteobacteria bacterium]|uniref:ABC transporter ATP-binding protein n=1 Tax=Candidatus Zymogenus saltonus TaxID=2844893 RepID=A0A9D8KGQ4_9DELT|nr:ABC transporter ATP-binding protein [Candidatus Zymogenus saltonus]